MTSPQPQLAREPLNGESPASDIDWVIIDANDLERLCSGGEVDTTNIFGVPVRLVGRAFSSNELEELQHAGVVVDYFPTGSAFALTVLPRSGRVTLQGYLH